MELTEQPERIAEVMAETRKTTLRFGAIPRRRGCLPRWFGAAPAEAGVSRINHLIYA
jgi:hypothetical protein